MARLLKSNFFPDRVSTVTENEDIRLEFEKFGRIASLEMSLDHTYCFVRYENAEAHNTAMDALNGQKIGEAEMLICLD